MIHAEDWCSRDSILLNHSQGYKLFSISNNKDFTLILIFEPSI